MAISYRPARADELERAEELVAQSINDLCVRHGFGQIASLRPPHFQLFSLNDDPDGLWVAEDQGKLLGFAFSWVCGDLWFLAELFVAPGLQGSGIGTELLRRTLDHAANTGARTKALITFAFNTVSQGLYIRHGMLARIPISFVKGDRKTLQGRGKGLELQATPLSGRDLARLAEVDRSALGISREKHHRYLATDSSMSGFVYRDAGEIVGYAYINGEGHIGPLAVTRTEVTAPALRAAVSIALNRGAAQATAFLPGVSDGAFEVAAQLGMRVTFPFVLMSSREFGDWTRYLPRNPGFM